MFAGFCFYAYYKFVRYEEAPPTPPSADGSPTAIPAGLLPERPKPATPSDDDTTLHEYNAYLAELAKSDDDDRTSR